MNSILVTGAAGYLGGHIVELIQKHQPYRAVVAVDDLSNHNKSILSWLKYKKNIHFFEADFADVSVLKYICKKYHVSDVIHLAAKKYPGESFHLKNSYWKTNVSKLEVFLQSLTEIGIKTLVFSSSASVYGEPKYVPIDEHHKLNPQSPYATTKSKGEELCKIWQRKNDGSKCIILRYFNPIGYSPKFRHQPPLLSENMTIQDVLIATISNSNNILSIYGTDHATEDGTCIRDFLHVTDLSLAHLAALDNARVIENIETINVGTGQGTTILSLIRKFSGQKNINIQYVDEGRRKDEISISYSDVGRAKKIINWSPKFSLEEMIDAINP